MHEQQGFFCKSVNPRIITKFAENGKKTSTGRNRTELGWGSCSHWANRPAGKERRAGAGPRLGEAGRGQHDHDEQSSSRLQRRQESGRGRPRRGTPARKMADVGSQAWGGDKGTDGEARAR